MNPLDQNTTRQSQYIYQPLSLTPEGHIVQVRPQPYAQRAQFPLEQNSFVRDAKKTADYWSTLLKVANVLTIVPLIFIVATEFLSDYDDIDPVFYPLVGLLVLGILVCVKGIKTSNSADVTEAKQYLTVLCCYVAGWLIYELTLLAILVLALIIDDSQSEEDSDMVGAVTIVWISFCVTMTISSLYLLFAYKAYSSRKILTEAASNFSTPHFGIEMRV